MGILSRIFGSDSVIEKAADGIYNGVDKAIYTDEEKANGFLDLLKSYEPFKLAQRLIGLSVVIPYVLTWSIIVLMIVVGSCIDEPTTGIALVNSAKDLGELNNDTLGTPVALILTFYFGGGALEGVVGRFKKKE